VDIRRGIRIFKTVVSGDPARTCLGEIAGRLADVAVVTSDNPRSEDPAAIVAQVAEGVLDVWAGRLPGWARDRTATRPTPLVQQA
jgi:hypothetical protein